VFACIVLFCCLQAATAQSVTLDSTFGKDGITVISNVGIIHRIIFDQFGNIFALGTDETFFGNLVIIKTDFNGIIDKSFGINGITSIETTLTSISEFKITSEKKILFVGGDPLCIIQLNEDGSFDNSFGDNGKIILNTIYDFIPSVNIENDDFMLIGDGASISKYNYNGKIDSTFGIDGNVSLIFDAETFIMPLCIKILHDHSILVAGSAYNYFPGNAPLSVCKLNSNGNLFKDFADHGKWIMYLEGGGGVDDQYFKEIIEDTNGNLLLFGSANKPFMSCFFANGEVNKNFGDNGFSYFEDLMPISVFQKGFLQHENKYIIGSCHKILSVNQYGFLDTAFNNIGWFDLENFHFNHFEFQDIDKLVLGGSSNGNFSLVRLNIPPPELSVIPFNNSNNSIVVFPNPAKDYLYFSSEKKFEIMDMQGKVLLKSEKPVQLVNVSHLKAGVYFIKFECGRVGKFIKS